MVNKSYEKDFGYFRKSYSESMQKMFAAVSDLYAEYWHDFFHFAIFNDPTSGINWKTAFEMTHKKYLAAIRADKAKSILELACGRGGFSDFLAEHTDAAVLGIDISKSQLSHANRFRRSNLAFRQYDIMHIDEMGQKFDAVVFMDADCYLPDKKVAIEKISKVINLGGRFLFIAWCKQDGLNAVQEELALFPFMKYWAIPSLETVGNYKKYFKKNNLNIIELEDLNEKVRPNWDFGYEQALRGIKELSYKDLPKMMWKGMKLGPDGVRLIKEQFPAAIYIKTAFDAGFLRYTYFVAEKE